MKARKVIASQLLLLLFALSVRADVYSWNAATGLFPDQVNPSMMLTDESAVYNPLLQGGVLTLQTAVGEGMTYSQQTNLNIPVHLEIDFTMRYISGTTTSPARSPALIFLDTDVDVGAAIIIGPNYVASVDREIRQSAAVDTTATFHNYQIKFDNIGLGDSFTVFQDNVALFQDTLLNDPGFSPEIGFGDGSSAAYGVSEWKAFSHNAQVPEPHSGLLSGMAILLLTALRWRKRGVLVVTCLTFLVLCRTESHAAELKWSTQFGTPATEEATGIAVDSAGRSWVGGSAFSASIAEEFSLTRLSPSGSVDFTRTRASSDGYASEGLAVAVLGNRVFIAGQTEGSMDGHFPPGPLHPGNAVVIGYDQTGNWLWTTFPGGFTQSAYLALAANASNLVAGGNALASFAGQSFAGGTADAVITKLDASGSVLWSRLVGGSSVDEGKGVALDISGNAYLVGTTQGTLPGSSSSGNSDAFIARFDASGNRTLLKQFGTIGGEIAYTVKADALGNMYIAGVTSGAAGTLFLGGQQKFGSADAFALKLDVSGNLLWARLIGGSGDDYASALDIDSAGDVWIGGYTTGSIGIHSNAGGDDGFVAGFSSSGDPLDLAFIASAGNDQITGLALGADNMLYVSGTTNGSLFGLNQGSTDTFAAAYSVPEPNSWSILCLGGMVIAGSFGRNRRQQAAVFSACSDSGEGLMESIPPRPKIRWRKGSQRLRENPNSLASLCAAFGVSLMLFCEPPSALAETQTFDSESAAATAGWLSSQATLFGNNFGFSNSSNAGGALPAGEAGGIFSRSAGPAYYADTTIGGQIIRSTPLAASGELGVSIISKSPPYNGSVFIGFLNTTETNLNSFDGEVGVNIAELSSSGLRFRASISFSDGIAEFGNELDLTNVINEPLTWSFTFDPTGGPGGFGRLTGTIDGQGGGTSVLDLTAVDAGKSFSLNAFGISNPQTTNPSAQSLVQLYVENVAYVPEPGSVILLFAGIPVLAFWRGRRAGSA